MRGGLDYASEVDAGDHREAAHHGRLAGQGEAVLVVEGRVRHADRNVALHQVGLVEVLEADALAALALFDHDRLERSHPSLLFFLMLGCAAPARARQDHSAGTGMAGRSTGSSSIGRLIAAEASPSATESHQTRL